MSSSTPAEIDEDDSATTTASSSNQTTDGSGSGNTSSGDDSELDEGAGSGPDDVNGGDATGDVSTTTSAVASSTSETSEEELMEEIGTESNEEAEESTINAESNSTSTATTTIEEVLVGPTITSVITEGLHHQFDEHQCVSVGDGSFYCSAQAETATVMSDGVYSAPDAEGDMEIFVTLNNETSQLTDNAIDDRAPFYDARSNRIVWHALINDRYQIMSHDLDTNQTVQLTETRSNNMEPTAYGDVTLWQAWMGNDWDIVMHTENVTTILTANERHDIAPHMRGKHVVWQTEASEGWKVALFDTETGATEFIESDAGGVPENPRFMLVYDATDENGDTATIGYDLDSKVAVPLGVLPAELPDELPEPDQTGEERALIQVRSSTAEDDLVIVAPDDLDGADSPDVIVSSTLDAVDGATVENQLVPTSTPESAAAELTLDLSISAPEVESAPNDLIIANLIQSTTTDAENE